MQPRGARGFALFLALLAVGCALRGPHRGLVVERAGGVALQRPGGPRDLLVLGPESRPLLGLEGCGVELTGPRLCRVVFVDGWRVVDGGDGSVPYVGRLRQHGSHLVLDDRDSGMPVVLDAPGQPALTGEAGRVVLVVGFVVGPQVVRVVEYRVLPD